MFRGHNNVTFNEASMKEAVQEYLAKRCVPEYTPTVLSIRYIPNGAMGLFDVCLKEPDGKK